MIFGLYEDDVKICGVVMGYTDFYGVGVENYPRFLERWANLRTGRICHPAPRW